MKSISSGRRQPGKIRIDFSSTHQRERDIQLCVLAFGRFEPPEAREFFLPQGEMAQDAFDREVEDAWARLTPGQQAAVMDGRFRVRAIPVQQHRREPRPHFDFDGEVVDMTDVKEIEE